MTRRLVLVGGGHAHVGVLQRLAERPLPGVEVTLVSPAARPHYSGMVPGYLHGAYAEEELALDLVWLCRRANVRLVEDTARAVDGPGRALLLSAGRLRFDALALDVGSDPAGLEVPGVREHAVTVRPMDRAVALRARVDAAAAAGGSVRVAVVGAGAGGFEVALALHRRIARAGARPRITLVEAGDSVLAEYAAPVRRRAAAILGGRGIAVVTGRAVVRVDADAVALAGGTTLPANVVVWLAGAAGPALLRTGGLPVDARGFLRVDGTLRAVDGSPVWGAGDCVSLAGAPAVPKAGVYAVRQGPVLAANLRAAFGDGAPRRYAPQRSFLSLLNTADGKALLRWHRVVRHARWAWWLKDRIDRRFVRATRPAS